MNFKEEKRKFHYYLFAAFIVWLVVNLLNDFHVDFYGNTDFIPSMLELIGLILVMSSIMLFFNFDYYSKIITENKLTYNNITVVLFITGFTIFLMALLYAMVVPV